MDRILVVVAFLAIAASPLATDAGPLPGEIFTLGVGEQTTVADADVTVAFDGVGSDSRCPMNAYCLWEGDASAALRVRDASGVELGLALHTHPDWENEAPVGSWTLRLLSVSPYPVDVEPPIDPQSYRVSLVLLPPEPIPDDETPWSVVKALYRR